MRQVTSPPKPETAAVGPPGKPSPARLLMVIVASAFACEVSIMLLFWVLPPLPRLAEAILDGSLLTALLFPFAYFYVYRPLVTVETELTRRVEERTAELRASEERLRAVVETATDAIITADGRGTILAWNRAAEGMFGYLQDEALGKPLALIMPERFHDAHRRAMERLLSTGVPTLIGKTVEVVGRASGDRELPVEVSLGVWSSTGQRYFTAILRDLSERKRAEKALRESEQKYRSIFEHSVMGIYQTTLGGRYLAANPTLARVLGYECPEELMRQVTDLEHGFYVDPTARAEFRRRAEEQDTVSELESQVYKKDGSIIWISENARAIREDEGVLIGFEGTTVDISERKRAEELLRYRLDIERLVAGISGHFIDMGSADLDAAITGALGAIGAFAGVDRSYVFQLSPDGTTHSNTHEWCAPGIAPQREMLQNLPADAFPWVMTRFKRFETVHVPRVADLPPEATEERKLFQAGEIRSLVVVPLVQGRTLLGFLGFDSVRRERTWSEEDIALLGVVGDIFVNAMQRRSAEEALRESEERYRTLVDNLAEGVAIVDPAERVLFSNPANDRVFGVPEGGLVGRNVMELVPPESRALIEEQRARRKAWQTSTYELEIVRPDGEKRSLLVTASPRLDRDGRLVATFGIVRDVTEQKRVQERIQLLAHALRSTGECVSITDRDDNILFVNEALLKTYGYREDELAGKPITILRPPGDPDDRVREILPATLSGGWQGELINRRKDGSELPIFLSTSVVRDDAGNPIALVGVSTDLTERKRLEAQLVHAQRMETVGALAGGMAHDFNNLMQAVLSHAQLLLAHPDDAERVCARAREIQEQVARGASLTRQLLVFSRREVVKPERLDLNELVRTTADFLHHLIRENVTVQLDLASAPLRIEADRGQLEQVVVNLAANASEAMPAGGRLAFATGLTENGDVELVVRDTGCGIPEGIRARIFEPFFSTKHASEGAGLGLAVVHGIVSKHDGRIAVESEVGKGTTFRITLPRKVSGEFAVVPETVVAPQGPSEGHGERVLLVEDEAAAREGLTEVLTVLGYEVVAVGSGEEAHALPAQPPFHLLLTDLLLPGVSGAELARSLAARWGDLKVIVMSGYAEDEAVRRGVAAGAVRFLQKPFDMATLAREARAALEA